MTNFIYPLQVLLPLTYALSMIFYAIFFYSNNSKAGVSGKTILIISILLHVLFLIFKSNFTQFPILTTMDSLSMIALSIASIHILMEYFLKEKKTGVFFIIIVFIFQTISSMFNTHVSSVNELLTNPMFGFHALLTIWGLSALAISALYGVLYWMLSSQIKQHHLGLIYKGLPPLEMLEIMGRFSSAIGLLLMGFGLLLGHLWSYKMLGYFFSIDAKILVTDFAWFAYLTGWILIAKKNLKGMKLIKLSVMGFIIFVFLIIIANKLESSFHRF